MPQRFWADAFLTAVCLINRLPSPVIQNQTPFFRLFHTHPNYTFLHVFSSACYPHLRPYNTHKLDLRSKLCTFIGYSLDHKGYLCYHAPSSRVYISRNVIFDEFSFPFQKACHATPFSSSSTFTSLPFSLQVPSVPTTAAHYMPARTAPLSCPPAHALVPTTDLPWPLAHTETLGCPPDNTSPPPPNNTPSSSDVVSHPSNTLSPEIPPAPPLPPSYPVRYRQLKVLTDGHI